MGLGDRTPLVSIIIPAYRRADLLNLTVASVVRQTFTDYELIVVDDASGEAVVAQYELPQSAQLLLRAQNSGRAATPRNEGFRVSCGQFVVFLDMDDMWLPSMLAQSVMMLNQHPEADVAYCHFRLIDQDGGLLPGQPSPRQVTDPLAEMISACFLWTPSQALIRRSALERHGLFDETIVGTADWDLWLRLAQDCEFIGYPEPLVQYRRHAAQQSQQPALMVAGALRVLEKTRTWVRTVRPDLVPLIDRRRAKWHRRYARVLLRQGAYRQAGEEARKCLQIEPMALGAYHLAAKAWLLGRCRREHA